MNVKRISQRFFPKATLPTLLYLVVSVHMQPELDSSWEIAFHGGNPSGIYVVNSDGTNLRTVLDESLVRGAQKPIWSPDGTQIAFETTDGEIYVMDYERGNVRNITSSTEFKDQSPTWSPNGVEIAYFSQSENDEGINQEDGSINVLNIQNMTRRNVVQQLGSPGHQYPVWSPNSNQIVFVGNRNRDYEIYVMDADGNNLHNLSNSPEGEDVEPVFSPDGHRIAFESYRDGFYGAYIVDIDGNNLQLLFEDGVRLWRRMAWSPDGTRILITIGEDEEVTDIYLIDLDNTNAVNLTNSSATYEVSPNWSPDGNQVAFWSDRNSGCYELFVMNIDGSNVHQLSHLADTVEGCIPSLYGEMAGYAHPVSWRPPPLDTTTKYPWTPSPSPSSRTCSPPSPTKRA